MMSQPVRPIERRCFLEQVHLSVGSGIGLMPAWTDCVTSYPQNHEQNEEISPHHSKGK